jgi:glycosyltransferase involved in cell wall biosynthesis
MPYIITLHGLFYSAYELNYACSKASHIIAVSVPIKNMLLDCMNENIELKVSVIYNTFDLSKYKNFNTDIDIRKTLNIKEYEKIVVYCSRLSFSKGKLAEQFIHAFYEVAKNIDNIHAVVIGDGPKKAQLDFYKNSLNTRLNKECIHILGATTNVIPYYLESMFVVGSARVAIEAMSCSKPVIAMGLKSIEGLVNHNNANDMIDCYFGDHSCINAKDISNLISTMTYLLNNEKECIELGNWSRTWCFENFNNDKYTNTLTAIYINYSLF